MWSQWIIFKLTKIHIVAWITYSYVIYVTFWIISKLKSIITPIKCWKLKVRCFFLFFFQLSVFLHHINLKKCRITKTIPFHFLFIIQQKRKFENFTQRLLSLKLTILIGIMMKYSRTFFLDFRLYTFYFNFWAFELQRGSRE